MAVFHSSKGISVCKSKVKFTTIPSIERAEKVLSKAYGEELVRYQCPYGNHWHLTHKDPSKRVGKGNQNNKNHTTEED